ncbi:unnamed protein product [Hapterophycus canaliculatus]
MFQSRLGQEAWIGPKVLPSRPPRSIVPPRVIVPVEETLKKMPNDREGACFDVAPTMAKDRNYKLTVTSPPALMKYAWLNMNDLKRRPCAKRGTSKSNEILVWGNLVVYTSPDEAESSLEAEEVDEQFVRLINVAENAQLRLMLEAGAELCGGRAALYVRVDPTCPIYWVRCCRKRTLT